MISSNYLLISCSGFACGLFLGSLENIHVTRSLIQYDDKYEPKLWVGVLKKIEQIKSRIYDSVKANTDNNKVFKIFIPRIFSPIVPLDQVLTLSIVCIWNVFLISQYPQATAVSLFFKGSSYCFKVVLMPVIKKISIIAFSSVIRRIPKILNINKYNLDISGHAVLQLSDGTYKASCLMALYQEGISSHLYKTVFALNVVGDFIWTYKTAASHHSVLDMVTAVACVGIGAVGLHFTGLLGYQAISFVASHVMLNEMA